MAETGLRVWRRAQLASQWPHLLTAVALGVAIPISVGVPDLDRPFGSPREIGVLIVMIAAVGGLFLGLAALTGRRRRELLLAGIAFGVVAAHPGLNPVVGSISDNPLTLSRSLAGAAAGAAAALLSAPTHRAPSAIRGLTVALAATAVAIHVAHTITGTALLGPAAALTVALTLLCGGSVVHITGVRSADGGLIAIGVLAASAGLGLTLSLVGGTSGLTVGVATITMLSVILAALAAFMTFLDSLERRDLSRDTQRLARSLELARLAAESDRHAELAHDQRTALLAIEAAAHRLRDYPTGALADAVATEAARLQRMLDGPTADRGRFTVEQVVSPVVLCSTARYGPIELNVTGPTSAWGHIDDTAEIVRALVDNAYEHGAAPICVDISGGAGGVVVRVRDEGSGVPTALRDVVFDRGVTSIPDSHSGLGLFAARRLARENGGELMIAPGDPATFVFRLPAGPPQNVAVDLDAGDSRPDPRSAVG